MFTKSNNPYDNNRRNKAVAWVLVIVVVGLLLAVCWQAKGCASGAREGIESWGWPTGPNERPEPHKRLLKESAEREKLRPA